MGTDLQNDRTKINKTSEVADRDSVIMDDNVQAESTIAEALDVPVSSSEDINKASVITFTKVQEYYVKETDEDIGDEDGTSIAAVVVDAVVSADALEIDDMDNVPDSSDMSQSEFVSISTRVLDELLSSDDFKPILRFTQEQLMIDWLTSRHLLTKNDFDE